MENNLYVAFINTFSLQCTWEMCDWCCARIHLKCSLLYRLSTMKGEGGGAVCFVLRGEIIKLFSNDVSSRPTESAKHLHYSPALTMSSFQCLDRIWPRLGKRDVNTFNVLRVSVRGSREFLRSSRWSPSFLGGFFKLQAESYCLYLRLLGLPAP